MFQKMLAAAAALMLTLTAMAQTTAKTTTKTNDFVSFERIEISGDFEVTFHHSDTYKVVWTTDTVLGDLVSVFVTGKTLFISFNQKGMSSELKKTYRGRKAPKPVFKADIYAPDFSEVSLSDNVVFDGTGSAIEFSNFKLELTGKAQLINLVVSAHTASLSLAKDAKVSMTLNSDEINVKAEKSAEVELIQDSDRLVVEASGSASVTLTGDTLDLITVTQNSATVTMTGSAETLRHEGKNSSEVDVVSMAIRSADVVMSGGKLYVNANDKLKVELKGGASVWFNGSPEFDIVNIQSSSLLHYTGSKRK